MKLNKREQLAVSVLETILEAVKNPGAYPKDISEGEESALFEVFGWNIKATTTRKGDLEKAVRGKEAPLLTVSGCGPQGGYSRQCFFPFQVKTRKAPKVGPAERERRERFEEMRNQLSRTIVRGGNEEDIRELVEMIKGATA
ncbi:hypothetical protein NF212_16095 [Parasalinivibrio latis]|uniref:hypothetical protein n=1 Tax=Parasalinivibrio latis TaxID=2952610 RepID=UPI0030DEC596